MLSEPPSPIGDLRSVRVVPANRQEPCATDRWSDARGPVVLQKLPMKVIQDRIRVQETGISTCSGGEFAQDR